jgi:hypothetical protein
MARTHTVMNGQARATCVRHALVACDRLHACPAVASVTLYFTWCAYKRPFAHQVYRLLYCTRWWSVNREAVAMREIVRRAC